MIFYDGGTVVEFKVTVVARWWSLKSRWWHGGGVRFLFFTVVARWWSSIFLTVAVVEVILTTVQTSNSGPINLPPPGDRFSIELGGLPA